MRQFGALSIRSKLIGVPSLFIAGMVGLGLFDLHSVRTIHGLMGEVQQNWMPGVRWAKRRLDEGVAEEGEAKARRARRLEEITQRFETSVGALSEALSANLRA